MENDNQMSAEQSLKLINETLTKNCRAIEKNQGVYYIFWGLLIIAVSAVVYLLMRKTGNFSWYYLWFLIPVIGMPVARFISVRNSANSPMTYIRKTVSRIWVAFGILALVLTGLASFSNFFVIDSYLITALLGFTVLTTAILIRSWPIITAGALIVLLGAVLTSYDGAQIFLIWMLCGFIMTVGGVVAQVVKR